MRNYLISAAWILTASTAAAQEFNVVQCQQPMGHHLIFEESVCPVDGSLFTNYTSMAYSTYGRYMDWEPVSYMSFPLPVGVCANGFVVDRMIDDFTPELIERRMQAVESPDYQQLSDGHTGYWLYYNLMSLTGESPEDLWWFALQATWEAEMCQTGEYDNYVAATLDELDRRAQELSPEDEVFVIVHFLRANMRRRIGELTEAAAVIDAFRRSHADQIDENWQTPFERLSMAIAEGVTTQLTVQPEDEPG